VGFDRDEALKQAEKLVRLGRLEQALAEYERVLAESPDDWKTVTAAADVYLRANQPARATALFNRQADHLASLGFVPRAEAFYKRVLKIEPLNEHALDRLISIAIKSGIVVEARLHLTTLARARQARGDGEGAAAALLRINTLDPGESAARRDARGAASAGDGERAAESPRAAIDLEAVERRDEPPDLPHEVPFADWPAAERQADEALAAGDGSGAATVLKQFVARHQGHVLALVKLVEVAVEAGLETERTAAQDALCGAYLAAGHGAEARIIAEDLLTRAPDDARFRERLRQALVLTGAAAAGEPATHDPFKLAHGAIDLGAILGDDQDASAEGRTGTAVAPEVDLSAVIDGLKPHSLAAAVAQKGSSMPDRPDPSNLDDVFRDFRDEVSRQNAVDQAEQHYKVALTYRDMGMVDDAVRELEQAAKSPRLRFDAAALLARLLRDRGDVASAVEWFERAAEAPAPTPEAGRQLLYELGQALEESSETSRALAVYLELQADARDYRDVTARVDRLSRVQTES
jgi:tetratricopeptide (TPR) repeat protein